MAEKMLDPTSLEAGMKYGRPEDVGSIESTDEGVMDRVSRAVQETAEALGLSRTASQKLSEVARFAGENAPVTGDVNDAYDVKRGLEKGEYGQAAAASLGFIPFIGGALRRGADMTLDLFKGADKMIQAEALRLTAKDLGRIPNPNNEKDVIALVTNARDIERQKIIESNIRRDAPRAEDRADWLTRDREDPAMYHGTKKGSADAIDYEGMQPQPHKELSDEGTSFSSDPIYAARHFGESDTSQLYEGKLNDPEMMKDVRNLSPEEYDLSHESGGIMNRGDEDIGAKIPKTTSFRSEAETVIFDPEGDMIIERLRDSNPEKAEWLQKGVDKANSVRMLQTSILDKVLDMGVMEEKVSPKEARELYRNIRENMKDALSLAQYTEDNSARGTFDWYISNFTREGELGVDVQTGLEKLQESLVGEQNKEEIGKLIEAIDMYKLDTEAGIHSASDMATGTARMAKEQITDLTKTMAVGGVVTSVAEDRKREVDDLTRRNANGELTDEEFKAEMRSVTAKYKPALKEEMAMRY